MFQAVASTTNCSTVYPAEKKYSLVTSAEASPAKSSVAPRNPRVKVRVLTGRTAPRDGRRARGAGRRTKRRAPTTGRRKTRGRKGGYRGPRGRRGAPRGFPTPPPTERGRRGRCTPP